MEEPNVASSPAPVSSFVTRAANIFSAPNELYSEVAVSPVQQSSWVVPLLLSVVVTVLVAFALFSNDSLRYQTMEAQRRAIAEGVQRGQMTQAQADRAAEMMSGSSFIAVIGVVTGAIVSTVLFFVVPLVLWLAAKLLLKGSSNYKKILEVYGLATLIGTLGSIITLVLMYMLDSIYVSPGGGLFFVGGGFDSTKPHHLMLMHLSVFTIWQGVVAGVGVAKVSGKGSGTGISLLLGLWLLWVVVTSLLGWGFQ